KAVRAGRGRVDGHHTHALVDALGANGTRELHQRGIAHRAGDVVVGRQLAGQTDDVDDHAALAGVHLLQHGARRVDVAENLQFPGRAPLGLVHGQQVTARNGTGVVDQDVDAGAGLDQCPRRVADTEIDGVGLDLDVEPRAQTVTCRREALRTARGDM